MENLWCKTLCVRSQPDELELERFLIFIRRFSQYHAIETAGGVDSDKELTKDVLAASADSLPMVWTAAHDSVSDMRRILRKAVLLSLARQGTWASWMDVVMKNELEFTDHLGDEHTCELSAFIMDISQFKQGIPRMFDQVNLSKHKTLLSIRVLLRRVLLRELRDSQTPPQWELWMYRVLTRDLSSLTPAEADRAGKLMESLFSYGRSIIPYALWAFVSCSAPMDQWRDKNIEITLSNQDILALVEDLALIVPDLRDENGGHKLLNLLKFVNYYTVLCHLVSERLVTNTNATSSPFDSNGPENQTAMLDYDTLAQPFHQVSQVFNRVFLQYLSPQWKPLREEYAYAERSLKICKVMNAKMEGMVPQEIIGTLEEISKRRG